MVIILIRYLKPRIVSIVKIYDTGSDGDIWREYVEFNLKGKKVTTIYYKV